MEAILQSIKDCFLKKEDYLIEFSKADTRIEGWFKAEMIFLLSELGITFRPEVLSPGHKKIDFELEISGEKHFCELKAFCISEEKTQRDLNFYFRKGIGGFIEDFKKLDDLH